MSITYAAQPAARPTDPSDTPQAAYTAAVKALRTMGTSLGAAMEIRYEAPPGFRPVPNRDGVLNPTLDLVTDPRRVDLGRAIYAAQNELTRAAVLIASAADGLDRAITGWEGGA